MDPATAGTIFTGSFLGRQWRIMKNVVEQHNIKKLSYLSEPIWNRCPCIPPSPRHDLQEPHPLETMWRWAAAKVIPYPKRRDDASGSRQNKVKLLVPSGTSVYSRLGEISSPSQVYWLGMRSSYRNAELVNVKLMVNTPFLSGCDWIVAVRRILVRVSFI